MMNASHANDPADQWTEASGVLARQPRRKIAGTTTVKQLTVRKIAKGAGTVVLGLIVLDLVATTATLILGWGLLKR